MEYPAKIARKVNHKWGFGMAPIKPHVQNERARAARTVVDHISGSRSSTLGRLDDVSTIKGLFSRSFKKDQWDWFTVWSQLGFPKYHEAQWIAGELGDLRRALRDADTTVEKGRLANLRSLGVSEILEGFISGRDPDVSDFGFIYMLSTRENPEILKIGYTNRNVFTRVKEINSATGVVIPFGARSAWKVPRAREVESDIHALLSEYRIRDDREFFNIPFRAAASKIEEYLKENHNSS